MARPLVKAILQPTAASTRLVLASLPYPTPAEGDYVIKVQAVAPCKDERGWEQADPHFFTKPRDRVPCIEGSGTVVSAPSGSSTLAPGSDVFFMLDAGVTGALRQYAEVAASGVSLKPSSLSFSQAAAVPLSAVTAWQGLFEHGPLDPTAVQDGDAAASDRARHANKAIRVLVAGAAGGVGSWAVKLAAAAGATVLGVTRPAKSELVRSFGAVEAVDYAGAEALSGHHKGVDLVLDTVGGKDGMRQLWGAVKDDGLFLEVGDGNPDSVRPPGKKADSKWYLVHTDADQLQAISRLIDTDGLRPLVDEVYPFEQFEAAFEKVDGGTTRGKVVITLN